MTNTQETELRLDANSQFSYSCNRCKACCINKIIQINPYEIARLANAIGISTNELKLKYTNDGVYLKQDENGACLFLNEEGCNVHANRPLVCRIFPLGRHIRENGDIFYTHGNWKPAPNGDYGDNGIVEDYLIAQGVAQFADFADAYFKFYCRLRDYLTQQQDDNSPPPYEDILDLEAVVAQYCQENSIAPPNDLEGRAKLHIEILDKLLT